MALPVSLLNQASQSLDVIVGDDGIVRLKRSVGVYSPSGMTADSGSQAVGTHVEGDTFIASDVVVTIAGADGGGVIRPALIDTGGRLVARTQPATGGLTDRSSTITAGGTSQDLAAVKLDRKYLFIQNLSVEDLWINFTSAAAANTVGSIQIAPGGSFVMEGSYVTSEKVTIIGATTGSKYTAKEA